jgi:hypothetical protein
MEPFENEKLEGYDDARSDEPVPTLPFIEFWVWRDGELIPATAEELVWIHECEREREARWRLRQWQQVERRQTSLSPARRAQAELARAFAGWRTRWQRQPRAPGNTAHDKIPFHGL